MHSNNFKATIRTATFVVAFLLLATRWTLAQVTVNLTAQPTSIKMPDGQLVPMWGYFCGSAPPACSKLNPAAAGWSPVMITVPTGQPLNINLTNSLTFPVAGGSPNTVPTSLVIVGQLGGGLGTTATLTPSPAHGALGTTWPIANTGAVNNPPPQGPRVQSFSTEVAYGGTTTLSWSNLRPGTYLLESGTHPSIQATMGLYGIVVVTGAPAGATAGTAYPGVTYNADVPLVFGEIDPNQNKAVTTAVSTAGFKESSTRSSVPPGPLSSITVTAVGHSYPSTAVVTITGGGGTGAHATPTVDPTTGAITAITLDNAGSGYTSVPTIAISGAPGVGAAAVAEVTATGTASVCSDGAAACYPPVVNYTPLYYLINGSAFDKTNAAASFYNTTPATGVTGSVLVRMVNAGSRMHVPALVGTTTGTIPGFSLIAEDGNVLPGVPRTQNEVFLAAGKTYDVKIDAPAASGKAIAVFDRQLSLSAASTNRDSGMVAYIGANNATLPATTGFGGAHAVADTYNAVIAGQTLNVADASKGVIANDTNVFGVNVTTGPTKGTVTLNADGTFTYVANAGWTAPDTFTYCGNGAASGAACAVVTLGAETIEAASGITCSNTSFTSSVATTLKISAPGVLTGCKDGAGYPLTVALTGASAPVPSTNLHLSVDANGAFTATVPGGGVYTFTFAAKNSQGTVSAGTATVTLNFPQASGLQVTVLDGADKKTVITDYRWIIEEDRTFFVDPKCTQNPLPAGCPGAASGIVPNFGMNFHSSFMPVIASGCTDVVSCGSGQTVLGQPASGQIPTKPSDVGLCDIVNHPEITNCLDPRKRYYISVLPGDAAQPFIAGYADVPDCSPAGVAAGSCGHGMGGSPIAKGPHDATQSIMVLTEPSPYPPATLSVFVFEDDYPLNGEHDAGGGIDTLSPNEPGLGGFQVTLADDAGGTGDATGTPTFDMSNMPLSNSLIGTIDPVTQLDACPVSTQVTATSEGGDSSQNGITGMIVTCPKFESDGKTLSPLAGQALVKNLYQGRYGVIANPGADRLAAGEEWLQTNTLDGQKAHDSFMRIGEPGYFQEFGPAGYHVSIGFANPKIINDRGKGLCPTAAACPGEVKGHVTTARMSRTPDERLYGSGNHDAFGFTQCYISIGDPDGADFGFQKCDADGNFDFTGVPPGNWKITTFDQWNDQVVDGITTPVAICDPSKTVGCTPIVDMGEVAVHQWQSNIYTRSFIDVDGNGRSTKNTTGVPCTDTNVPAGCNPNYGADTEPGLALEATNIRFRDGSFSNFNNTDLNGYAGFNEVFPLFNWYVVETDSTRYKNTGVHVVYDAGGPVDGSSPGGVSCASSSTTTKACGSSVIADGLANTYEPNPLPPDLSIPGAVYCAEGADCGSSTIAGAAVPSSLTNHSTGRIDPPWVNSYGWQGFSGQNSFLEFGKKPFADGENGGIHGHVVYSSTRPFDDPQLLLQLSWEPLIPHVRVNLYKEGFATDGITPTLSLIDYTDTTSFDDWAQGFRSDGVPLMNCPGQSTTDMFFFGLKDQPQWLDLYNNNGSVTHALPYDAQYKCYDGMHNWNQLQPAPYDGMFQFPSVTGLNPTTGKPLGSNCTACIPNPDATDPYRKGLPMLPDGKYVVEVVVPPGYELVKEEDKNILIGDNYIAPVTQQFAGLGNIFILPDQAELAAAINANNSLNSTSNQGRTGNLPSHEGDTGSDETFWPCVGQERTVPDYISLFPGSLEAAPFAGAKRHLCDRKEVSLTDQSTGLTKFYLFTPTHTAAHFTGVITDDFSAEFDPYSPQFGEKFAPAYLPISFKDWAGNEITRIYSDGWGAYNGLNYSTWEVNPPNPTGYGPTMMVGCMNDAGPVLDPTSGQMVPDPLYQDGYSQFCYELPFMPGQSGYFDTPVVPTSAFAGGYNNPDCAYPDATPAVSRVDGDGVGPWVAGVQGTVASVSVSNGGSGYTSAPTVTFNNTGTGGTGAAGTAVISGTVKSITITNAGEYAFGSTPVITISGGGGSGATASANMSTGNVRSISISAGGSGYTTRPTVQFVGGGGTGAAGTANLTAGRVTSVTINSRGTGYTSAPSVLFVNGGGSGATGTVNLGQTVLSATLTNPGAGFTGTPTVSFSPAPPPQAGGTRAQGTALESASVIAVNLTNNGSGYTGTPTITLTGGGGNGAAAAAIVELNGTLTITSLGNLSVDNYAYSGPSASTAPFNQQKTLRHYGFGAQCTTPTGAATCNTASSVTIGGVTAPIVSWADNQIKVQVPAGVAACTVQQQTLYGGSKALCGQLVITAGNGKQSVDAVSVTIGGKTPTVMAAGQTIQNAIDAANPGDLIIVPPGSYSEMVLMWKPVRLQGVGAASVAIDANPHPAGKLNPWRRQVVCLFGLALNGTPISGSNAYDPSSTFTCSPDMQFSVDRAPLEATVGWDATLNGNLAEQLIEPTIMGAYEGAGITVLSKGVKFPAGSNPFASDVFPDGTQLLTANDCGNGIAANRYPSNFLCNPSRIDGLTVKNSSQGGGGIMVHAWGHKLEISNNRVLNNQGTLSGGITVGQGEHPDAYLARDIATTVPGSCITSLPNSVQTNLALPYCYNVDVNVHNNMVTQNSSLGDELFSSTPAGAGGVTFCNGSDYYKFGYNWVCGNMSTGDGAGVAHIGLSYDGDIEHNTILFNQTTNPTIVTNGGGLLIMGAPDADPPCGLVTDQDCVSAPGTISPSDGTGPGLVINANLILGNSADSGSGGGLRLQHINGTDVLNFPKGNATTTWPVISGHNSQPGFQSKTPWNAIQVTNNIIANNVAGWDGGGISLQDALATDLVNNTIVSNTSTASSGVLFQTLFAPLASTQGTNCTSTSGGASCPQVAGLVSVTNSAVLQANISQLPAGTTVTCPTAHGTAGSCTKYSVPVLYNDLFWQNRAFSIGVGGLDTGLHNQQNLVTLYNAGFVTPTTTAPTKAADQNATGACNDTNASYWDIGVRGDVGPGDHTAGLLTPSYSVLTNSTPLAETTDTTTNLLAGAKSVNSVYCNGSRTPVEAGGLGWELPPGTNESNALPAPPFTLLVGATVDEGNNWINLRWGPLALNLPSPTTGNPLFTLDPTLVTGSPAINHIPSSATLQFGAAPSKDFYEHDRKVNNSPVDVGAIEVSVAAPTLASITPASGARGTTVAVTLSGANLTGTSAIAAGTGITVNTITVVNSTTVTANFVISGTATLGAHNVTVTTPGGTSNAVTFTVTAPAGPTITSIVPATGQRDKFVDVTITGANLAGATVSVSGTTFLLGTQIPVSNVVAGSTTITARFTINSFADLGAHTVTVTTGGGTATTTFTVTQAGTPTLVSINPTSHNRGGVIIPQNFNVTLTGTNFTAGATVNLSGSGTGIIRLPAVVSADGTTITQNWSLFSGAATGARTVTVTSGGTTTSGVTFTIN